MMIFLRILRIIFILFKHGSLSILVDLKFLPPLPFSSKYNASSKGKKIRLVLEDLGPFFVKFGQTLATRSDIIGDEISHELSLLQDRIEPKMSKKEASIIIRESLKKEIHEFFKDFSEKPIAAASISEVFVAETIDGKKVAVKILKPGIEKLLYRDIKLFFFLARLIDKNFSSFRRLQLVEVVKVFQNSIKKEMDLTLEAAAASELKDNHSKDCGIYIPKIYWESTSKNILTIEWLDGVPIYKKSELKKQKINISKVVHNFAFMFFNQAYRDGFFHADLHPGNVLVNKSGDIELIDFGIMGRLDHKTRVYLAEILRGFLNKDYYHVAKIHFAAGYVSKEYSIDEFAQACRAIGEPIIGVSNDQISVGTLLSRLFKLTKDFNMQTQPQLLLVQKTTLVVEGVISSLDPQANIWEIARPWVEKWSDSSSFETSIINVVHDLVSFIKNDFAIFFKKDHIHKENIKKVKKRHFLTQLLLILFATLGGFLLLEKLM